MAALRTEIDVRRLGDPEMERWDAYVDAHPDATFFHRAALGRVIEKGTGKKPYYLMAERARRICGVLPLIHVKSPLFGNTLISTGFFVYGGPLVDDEAALDALDQAAIELGDRLGVSAIEYRNHRRLHPDWPCKAEQYAAFKREIFEDPDANLKAIPRKQRAVVRKAMKSGLQAQFEPDIDRFFHMYATSVRNLGTPVFPRKLFRALLEEFDRDCEILTLVTPAGQPVTSVMSFYFRDEVLPYYAGGLPMARKLGANDYMYWVLMEHARRRGCRQFDFGRSKIGTGSYKFKKYWGFEPKPLFYEYHLAEGAEIPDVNPLNPKYRLMVNTWKRMPVGMAKRLGPLISRDLG